MTTTDAQTLAEACAQAMYARDRASQTAGMTIDAVAPGYARVAMTLLPQMVNGHQIAHGGAIFALADSSFALPATRATLPRSRSIARSPISRRDVRARSWLRSVRKPTSPGASASTT